MKRVKRILKWLFILLLVALAIPVLALLGIWGIYENVVRSTPGDLSPAIPPATLGARVDPFIATGGVPWMCGHDSPAATVPFGMVRLSPDTASLFTNTRGLNRSGYFYGDNKIIGFSHTRLVGADAQEGGVFRIFPSTVSAVELDPGDERFARFSHEDETASPGYYAVTLPEEEILAELTASTRVGIHRYTFPADSTPHLLLDAASVLGDKRSENARLMILPEASQVEGSVRIYGSFSGRYDGLDVYFVAQFNQPFDSYGVWNDTAFTAGGLSAQANAAGADLGFARQPQAQQVEVRLAISYVSIKNARDNLAAEATDKSFESLCTAARDQWEGYLSRIQVEGGTERQQRIFYTALSRAFQMPTTFNDVNGEYTGFDRTTHNVVNGAVYYTDFSLWDSFRTVHPLYNLIARREQSDMMASLVAMGQAGGCLPRWPSGAGYTNCMFGTPADIAVSEAYLKGIRGFDIDAAYAMMRQTALVGTPEGTRFAGREGLADYLKYGYCPEDTMSDAVSATLEYGWCDTALMLLATELGHHDDAERFAKNAQNYRNLWDADQLFFVPRDTRGLFTEIFDPLVLSYTDSGRKYTDDFVEGSAMMWRWSVPFDAPGLVSLFPSKEQFVVALEHYLEQSNATVGEWAPGSHYWHGNEPFFNAAYLFNAAGRPELTQKWVRHLLETKYDDSYYGMDGNDDGGTLSSWYVWSALGFYPIAGTNIYELGAPLFEKATVAMGEGIVLKIVAENYGLDNLYVNSVHINGRAVTGTRITHEEIANGGEMRFRMSPRPARATAAEMPQ